MRPMLAIALVVAGVSTSTVVLGHGTSNAWPAESAITGSTVQRTRCRFGVRGPEYWRLPGAPVHHYRRCEMLL